MLAVFIYIYTYIYNDAAGNGLGATIKYPRSTTSGAAGNGLGTTAKYVRGAVGIGLGTTIKYFRRTTNAAAVKGLGTLYKQALMPVCQSLATFLTAISLVHRREKFDATAMAKFIARGIEPTAGETERRVEEGCGAAAPTC